MTVTGPVAACDRLTVNESCAAPVCPSVIVASPIESVGRTGAVPPPFRLRPVAVVPPLLPGVAWKPNATVPPAGTSAFQAALRTT